MDNASKALIIAGGIFLSVMIIGIAMYVISGARGVADESNRNLSASAAQAFNRYYQSYGGSIGGSPVTIKGLDVINICNKVEDDNWRASTQGSSSYTININTNITTTVEYLNSDEGIGYVIKNNPSYLYSYRDVDGDGYIDEITINQI